MREICPAGRGAHVCLVFAIPGVSGKSTGGESGDTASGCDILSTSSDLPGSVSSHGGHYLDDF